MSPLFTSVAIWRRYGSEYFLNSSSERMPAQESKTWSICAPDSTLAMRYLTTSFFAVTRIFSAASGYLLMNSRELSRPLLSCPCIVYVSKVQGAPLKPIKGALPSSFLRVIPTDSRTYPSFSRISTLSTSGKVFSTSSGVLMALTAYGSTPAVNLHSIPITGSRTKMSEKRIAASMPYLSMGWTVRSAAISGVLKHFMYPFASAIERNSGR
mmetsp:Transcript_16514/g.23142  ORF Transcript_16514/g.23142 Transcript_16514/m.23142 type:complete len:211 (-) Transcript_16514:386-1018(-)